MAAFEDAGFYCVDNMPVALLPKFLELMEQTYDIAPCGSEEYPTPAKRPANSILENARLKDAEINLFGDWQEELKAFAEQAKKQWTD